MFDGDEPLPFDRDSDTSDKYMRSRRTTYASGNGMLSPRDIPRMSISSQRSPLYRDVSPHPLSSPTNNNINKTTPADQGHFVYPPTPEVSPRYPYGSSQNSTSQLSPIGQSMNSYSQMSSMSAENGPMGNSYEVPRGYTGMERYSNPESGSFLSPRSKATMGNTSYAAMSSSSSSMPYEYHRSFSPMVVDHVKHYSQYPIPERNYPAGYMFSPSVMAGANYPLQSSTSTASERYYPDVLEEFVDMQAAMHHGLPSRPVRGDYGYSPAILTN